MRSIMLGLPFLLPSLAFQSEPTPGDRFADEPERPKAHAPVQFSESWDEARAEARRTGRRILAYFTSDYCSWCRVLEKRTFTDAEVVALSTHFVCVELNTEKHPRLADEFRIDTVPRSYVMTAEGEEVDRRTGYLPPAEYAAWLEAARTKTPAPVVMKEPAPDAPQPVGAAASEADVVIWFVDASESIERWGDGDWTGHSHLLRLLRAARLRPRIEHIAREDFPARWAQATEIGRAPDLIAADRLAGLVRELSEVGRLVTVLSERLTTTPEVASCLDFASRLIFLVQDSPNEAVARRAAAELLEPGPETSLPGPDLPMISGRDEAIAVARRATAAYLSGDPEVLHQVASRSSPQLSRCTEAGEWMRTWEVEAGPVEIRGNERLAFARVEVVFRGETIFGADPVLVVLRREGSHWKAFSVSKDCLSIRELDALCRLELGPPADPGSPPVSRLLSPPDGGTIGANGKSFSWEIPDDGGALVAQVCQVLLNFENGCSWPETRLKVFPGQPRGRSLRWSETQMGLTGLVAEQMEWCAWAIGEGGRISVSEVREYRYPEFNY